jgi:2-dehydropantoate 2-reductase
MNPEPATSRRIATVGVGAVGAVFGSRLAQRGHTVAWIARGATREVLQARGLQVDGPEGTLHVPTPLVADDPARIGTVDLVLVCTKAGQVAAVAPSLTPLVGSHTLVIPMQNGVEASGQLAEWLGDGVMEGYCRVIAEQVGPGHIRHIGVTPTIAFGRRAGAGRPTDAEIADWTACFREAGIAVEVTPDIRQALWEKFMFVEPLGAVGAAARVPFGEMLAVAETRRLLDDCVREIAAVGRAIGVPLGEDGVARVWARYDSLPPQGTASMQRDLMAGRPSEFDAQTAAVCRLARAHGVPVPAHEVLFAVLTPQRHGEARR